VVEALAAHLASLPAPQFARVVSAVLGTGTPLSRDLAVDAVARQLLDREWLERTLARLGPAATAAFAAVVRAGTPVLRRDVTALSAHHDVDPVDVLEEHGLLTPVRTGRGMPTHVALTPGLQEIVVDSVAAAADERAPESAYAGSGRRFELALMLAFVAQHPPRLIRAGRVHGSDISRLAEHLAPLGLRTATLERRLNEWSDAGAARDVGGRLCPMSQAFTDIEELYLRLALSQLAAPSIPEGALQIVSRLLPAGAVLTLRDAIDFAQSLLLRSRAEASDMERKGARSELLEVARCVLTLDAVLLQDDAGRAVAMDEAHLLTTGSQSPRLVLEPSVAAILRGEALPKPVFRHGHVQSSFEVVADSTCDPSVVARVAVWSRLVRADRAAVLMLERPTVAQARALGFHLTDLLADLKMLSGMPVPGNVAFVLKDWFDAAPEATSHSLVDGQLLDFAYVRDAARTALGIGADRPDEA
jgi:hypothetical protein